jgi:2-dehydro-3-deoxyphosphogalactonate aldolase
MKSPIQKFASRFLDLPLVAILRGLTPDEAPEIGDALTQTGFGVLEVPLNSPRPFESIALMAKAYPDALVGAGTVLTPRQVQQVHDVGGQLIVSPNADVAVIREAVRLGLVCLPGIATPTEAFSALDAGAQGLKLFPAEGASPTVLKAMLAVLPAGTLMVPVGGISTINMAPWLAAGAHGFGLGSALYKPGKSADAVRQDATAFIAAYRGCLTA